jgi:hypothetical protein
VTPKQITEGHNDARDESSGEARESNRSGLETRSPGVDVGLAIVSGSNLTSTSSDVGVLNQNIKPPDEIVVRDSSDIISDSILAQADPLIKMHLQMLQEQYGSCMQMHRHYKEIAVNGTEADIGPTSADDMALDYLRQASQISQNITTMVNEMLRTSTKKTLEREKINRKTAQKLPEGANVTQNNTIFNFSEADQREKLRMMDTLAGKKMDGSLGIPDAKTLIASVTHTKDDRNEEEKQDAE